MVKRSLRRGREDERPSVDSWIQERVGKMETKAVLSQKVRRPAEGFAMLKYSNQCNNAAPD